MGCVTLYFIGWYKHGNVQHLVDGPFVSLDKAEVALTNYTEPNFIICEAEIKAKVVETIR
jgi:hypothetical protein